MHRQDPERERELPRAEVRALVESVRALQAQVEALNLQVSELREEQQRARAQATDPRPERVRGENLSPELSRIGPQGTTSGTGSGYPGPTNDSGAAGASPQRTPSGQQNLSASAPNTGPQAIGDRIDKIEEEQQFIDAKVNDQYQTKVESGSKYRLRLSGMVLLNLYDTRGAVDNQDFPEISTPLDRLDSRSAFGGTLRQSQIGLDVIQDACWDGGQHAWGEPILLIFANAFRSGFSLRRANSQSRKVLASKRAPARGTMTA